MDDVRFFLFMAVCGLLVIGAAMLVYWPFACREAKHVNRVAGTNLSCGDVYWGAPIKILVTPGGRFHVQSEGDE